MSEQERADALARTIDELITSTPNEQAAAEDETVSSWVSAAESRSRAGIEAGHRSTDNELAVLRHLAERIESSDGIADSSDTPTDEMHELVTARRRVAEDTHELAERHREDVWRRIQERIATRKPTRRGIFSFFRSSTADESHSPSQVTKDTRARCISDEGRSTESQRRLRARLRQDPANRHDRPRGTRRADRQRDD